MLNIGEMMIVETLKCSFGQYVPNPLWAFPATYWEVN